MKVREAIALLSEVDLDAELVGYDMYTEQIQPVTGFMDNGDQIEVETDIPEEEDEEDD